MQKPQFYLLLKRYFSKIDNRLIKKRDISNKNLYQNEAIEIL